MTAPTLKKQVEILTASNKERFDEIQSLKRAKNAAIETISDLEREVSNQRQELDNHNKNLRDIQRDMKTVCEAVYGNDFDPEWRGDRPMNIYQDGMEYAPLSMHSTIGPAEYVEPMQRLMRMIWRRTHWGLNPLILRDYQSPS